MFKRDAPPDVYADQEYRHQIEATAPADTSLTFTASGLPEGLSMTPDGLITGFDAKPGPYYVTFTATATHRLPGHAPVSDSITFRFTVYQARKPSFTGTLPPAASDQEYAYQVQATPPEGTSLTFTASGLPNGYSMTPDGLITGNLGTKPGSYDVTITATVQYHLPVRVPVTSSVTWKLVVGLDHPMIIGTLPATATNAKYSYQVQAIGPLGASLTFTASGLPRGFSMTPGGLIMSELDAESGSHAVTITVTAHPADPSLEATSTSATQTLEVVKHATQFPELPYLPARPNDAPTGTTWRDDLDRSHRVVWNGTLDWLEGYRSFTAQCPAGSWFDARTGTAKRDLGQGVYVITEYRETLVSAPRQYGDRTFAALPGGGEAVVKARIDALNPEWFTGRGLYIEVVCTKDPAFAWRG